MPTISSQAFGSEATTIGHQDSVAVSWIDRVTCRQDVTIRADDDSTER